MSVSVVKNNNNVSFFEGVAGIGAGYASYRGAQKLIKKPYRKYFMKELTSVPQAENDAMWKGAQKAFKTSPLIDKKVKMVDVNLENYKTFTKETIDKQFKKNEKIGVKIIDKFFEWLDNKFKNNLKEGIKSISKGENAGYLPATKTVAVNSKKLAFSTFHELGHSMNDMSKGFAGKLHKGRNFAALLAPVILFTSLLKKKKSEGEKPKSVWDKMTTFIKENCGKLMFVCLIPTIAEEGLASINANKLAKDVLKPNILKKMNKLNFKAWTSYIAAATIMGACGALAVWIKDRVAQPELAK